MIVSDYCNKTPQMKREESAVFVMLIPRSRTTCGKKKRHFDKLAEDTLDERRTALPNHGVQLCD